MAERDSTAYDPQAVERKWQQRWDERGTNHTDLGGAARPFYNLMMFPYPSAEGLHVGNVFAFTGADIYGRFRRLRGDDVFQPLGFDAFGIHSENYALKLGVHPAELIPRNVARFREQLKRVGLMVDWRYELSTTDPAYYKWTQWIFLQLYKAGLAVRKRAAVNWCPACKTVLANEQVINGYCERHPDVKGEQRVLEQRFFTITKYRFQEHTSQLPSPLFPSTTLSRSQDGARERAGDQRLLRAPPGREGRAARARAVVLHDHEVHRAAAGPPRDARLVGVYAAPPDQLDRPLRGRRAGVRDAGRQAHHRLHDAARHALWRHLHGPRPRAPAGARTHDRRVPGRGERLPTAGGEAGHRVAEGGRQGEDRRLHR